MWHQVSVFLEPFQTWFSWRLFSGSVMAAPVKFSWCHVMEFSILAGGTGVGLMGGSGCPGGMHRGSRYGSPQQTPWGTDSSLSFAPAEVP